MWVILEIGKKQYLVKEKDIIEVERLENNNKEDNKEIIFDKVLLSFMEEEGKVEIGTPYLKDYKVKTEILGEIKGEKLITYRYRRRKKSRNKKGHRQIYTRLKISSIVKG